MSDEPIIEIKSGTIRWRIWDDGRISGFPGGATVTGRAIRNGDTTRTIREGAVEANAKHEEWQKRVNSQR